MPQIALLHDVDVAAVSLVRKGANRQRFFMRKSDGAVVEVDEAQEDTAYADVDPLLEAPLVPDAVFAKSDWSAVYCVVAAPGVRENPGMLAKDGDPEDEWRDADEIRKAAHGFMRNGGLVNQMHVDLEPFGTLVENAIALEDVSIDGHTIAKGSWYIAIEPTDEGRAAIEAGEFTGVSLQGSGGREVVEVEKADPHAQGSKGVDRAGAKSYQTCPGCKSKVAKGVKKCPNCKRALTGSTGMNTVAKARVPIVNKPGATNYIEQGGGLPKKLRELAEELKGDGKTDSQAIRLAIGIGRDFAAGRTPNGKGKISAAKQAAWVATMAEYEALPAKARSKSALKKQDRPMGKLLAAMAKALGLNPDEYDDDELDAASEEEIVKALAVSTFSQRMAAREIEDDLPMAMDVLRGAMYDAIYPFAYGYPDPPAPADARAALDSSLQQFHEYLLSVFDRVTSGDIAKSDELRAMVGTLGENLPAGDDDQTEDEDMGDQSRIEKLEEDLGKLTTSVDTLVTGLAPVIAKAQEEAAPAPTVEDVQKQMTELVEGQAALAKSVERLGTGKSKQGDEPVEKSENTDPLAGILA